MSEKDEESAFDAARMRSLDDALHRSATAAGWDFGDERAEGILPELIQVHPLAVESPTFEAMIDALSETYGENAWLGWATWTHVDDDVTVTAGDEVLGTWTSGEMARLVAAYVSG